jgi:hypothetical protein
MQHQGPKIIIPPKSRWLWGFLAVLLFLQLVIPNRVWTFLLLGLGGMWAVSYVWAWQLALKLTVTREQH